MRQRPSTSQADSMPHQYLTALTDAQRQYLLLSRTLKGKSMALRATDPDGR